LGWEQFAPFHGLVLGRALADMKINMSTFPSTTRPTYPCPSCGFLVFDEVSGSYDICKICGWEDDHVQLAHPSMAGGANKRSLASHQSQALLIVPLGITEFKGHSRTPEWRPLFPSEFETQSAPTTGEKYFEDAAQESAPYYWLRNA